MSHNARIPLMSLINYQDEHLLDTLYFPDTENRSEFIDFFLLEYGEMTPLYTDPHFFKRFLTATSKSLKYTLDTLYQTLLFEYNPIENYDRNEWAKDVRTPDLQSKDTYASDQTDSGSESHVMTGGHTNQRGGSSTTENQVSADNTGDYFPSEKIIETPGDSDTTTYNSETQTIGFGKKVSHGGADTNNLTGQDTNEHNARIHGNIGTTTTQQMINEERDVARYNFWQEAARLYAERLLVLVY